MIKIIPTKKCKTCGSLFEKKYSCSKFEWENTVKYCSRACVNKGRSSWNKGIPQPESQKLAHSEKMKGRLAWNKGLRINNKTIIAINLENGVETEFSSIHEVVEVLKVGRCAIQNVLSGRGKRTSNNYTYKYKINNKDL